MNKPKTIKYLIIGAGPCGLGAAYKLKELEENDFLILEKQNRVGGLSASFKDKKGFTWDIGGHVLHSHYEYFDEMFEKHVLKECYKHQRSAWVWLYDEFVPYPFQNNLKYLPKEAQWDCVEGLLELKKSEKKNKKPSNFKEWLEASFGSGICKHFAYPYNFKVWAHPLEKMNRDWVGDRVAKVNLEKSIKNILLDQDDGQWGPNNIFYFPKNEGTGYIWETVAKTIPQENFMFDSEVTKVDRKKKVATLGNDQKIQYEHLISTMPLTLLLEQVESDDLELAQKNLDFSTTHVVGLGIEGETPKKFEEKCWIYFPENNSPFYRATLFAKYSPNNTAEPEKQWSLMCEIAESEYKKVNKENLIEEVIQGALNTQLIKSRKQVVSTWQFKANYGYPTPTVNRQKVIDKILHNLDDQDIYSRGRFGAWKYEVGNMDHSFMQGVEVIDKIVNNVEELTVWNPNKANSK